MEFVEAALHEIDEELCRDEMDELCYVVRMSQKRIWRRVWHSHSTPSDASKSEGTWRALSTRLCCKEEFDEMKRACAYLGLLPGARLQLAFGGTTSYLACSTDVARLNVTKERSARFSRPWDSSVQWGQPPFMESV